MQIKDFKLVDIKVIDSKNNNILYEGDVDYADKNIKDLYYKDVKATGSEVIFYI